MAKPSKRNAEEAFEEVMQPEVEVTGEKKRKKRRKNKKSDVVNALEESKRAKDIQEDNEQEFGAHEEPAQPEAEPEAISHGGKSKKKRKRAWKEKHALATPSSPTTPKKQTKGANKPMIEPEQEEPTPPTPNADGSEKKKKKRRRKKGKGGKGTDADAVDQQNEAAEASHDDDAQLQETPKATGTIGSHPVESVKDIKRRKKEAKKLARRQLQNQLEGGVEAESTSDHVKIAEPAEHPLAATLSDDMESAKKSKRRRKRSRSGRQSELIKREDSEADDQEGPEPAAVKKDSPEVTSIPLASRIEVPDEMKSRQEQTEADGDASSADELDVEVDEEDALALAIPEKKRKHKKHGHHTDYRDERQRKKSWYISEGTGGVFIDQDPILTSDDEHLILSTRSEARIYSRSTSLVVRSLRSEDPGHIVCYVLLKSNPSLLLVGTSEGIVSLWDWTDGSLLDAWSTADGLKQIVPITKEGALSILALYHKAKRYTLKAFHLGTGTDEATEVATLQDRKHLGTIMFFQVAGIIVTFAHSRVIIGHCRDFDLDQLNDNSFIWHELKLPSKVASFDAQVGPPVGKKRKLARIDLAVGMASGDILTYEDIAFKIRGKEQDPKSEDIEPRTLSWHRNLVNTVKWSPDGNYIISGGSETTLVMWQLDTNQQQYLPHLSNPILNLAVSDRGSAYALRLADNAVMVLGTANYSPETNVSGLAAPTTGRLVASLHPISSERLLVACPADPLLRIKSEDHNTSLQTYDLSADSQLGRQALTRNITTVVNVDPEGRPLREPNVSHLEISADGKWLATIDEWEPPAHDLDATHLPGEREVRKENSEIRLRIWSHNDDQGDWELVTRVDDPNSVARILSLQSNPARAEFAAVGADGIIRIWQPRARVRDGVRVRDAQGRQLFTWMSIHAVNVPMHGKEEAESAGMAYSDDGSILVVSLELDKKAVHWTYLIDARFGEVVHSEPNLVTAGERCLAFAGRSLVLLSKIICVYDVVNTQIVSRTELAKEYSDEGSSRFLSVNRLNNTFAIGFNRGGKHGGRLIILNVNKLGDGALLQEKIPGQIRALLASPSASGFVVIDGYSQIKQVKPPGQSRGLISTAAVEPEELAKGLDRVFGQGQAVNGEVNGAGAGAASKTRLLTNGDQGQDQIAGRTLDEALGFGTSATAPGVDDLFERIAGVFARPVVEA